MDESTSSQPWSEVFQRERAAIREPDGQTLGPDRPLTGLAFSGGGIRSATFNLGILQALSELRLLRHFDYLSCVSGGGYIGGWLSAFIDRQCNGRVEEAEPRLCTGGNEDAAVGFLRSYSNYLTPKASLLSADTLSAVATFLRNLYLNLTLLVLALGGLLLVPRLLLWWVRWATGDDAGAALGLLFGSAVVMVALAMGVVGVNLGAGAAIKRPFYARQTGVLWLVVLPLVLSAWLVGYGFFAGAESLTGLQPACWAVIGALVYLAPWAVGWGFGRRLSGQAREAEAFSPLRILEMAVYAALAGALGGLLLSLTAKTAAALAAWDHGYAGAWIASALLTAQVLLVYSLTVVAHIGLMGRRFSHETREWWSRLGGWVLIVAIVWAGVFGIVFLAPVVFAWAPGAVSSAGGVGWALSTAAGIVLGRSPKTAGDQRDTWRDTLAKLTPSIFIVGLLGLLAWGLHALLLHPALCASCVTGAPGGDPLLVLRQVASIEEQIDIRAVALLFVGSWVLAAALAWRINVNLFSIYHFYRQRLARCYLGASRAARRTPHPFTGFDFRDDRRLASLCRRVDDRTQCQRPYPIHNTAMNLVSGKQLAWQERRAAAFAFTPLACGYALQLPDAGHTRIEHYRPTAQYMNGVWLGSAIAISGAAASPNMGYHSSPALTFLMTVFNVRLGHWSPNPADDRTWQKHDPRFGGNYLLRELFGQTELDSPFVYLSDGGHFENLGIYELVRRRCACIVAIDAAQDADRQFNDLGNAIRKCYADFGVTIEIDTSGMKSAYFTVGRVHYPGGQTADLLYIKPNLIGGEPADLANYRATHPQFPHQSTADQWFDESQFESYRKLGHHIGRSVLATATNDAARGQANGVTGSLPLQAICELLREPPPRGF